MILLMKNSCVLMGVMIGAAVMSTSQFEKCNMVSQWGPWRCMGFEDSCGALPAYRYKCPGGNCVKESPCTGFPNFVESNKCLEVLKAGECVPYWSKWTQWTPCDEFCGHQERKRYRSCEGAYSSDHPEQLEQSCQDPDQVQHSVDKSYCPVRRPCPDVSGRWAPWTQWAGCSVTCGVGEQSRYRSCTAPPPSGNGLPCRGLDSQTEICVVKVNCPQNGMWCEWDRDVKVCSAQCGFTGMGLKRRACNCPPPKFGGADCPPDEDLIEQGNEFLKKRTRNMKRTEFSSFPTYAEPTDDEIQLILQSKATWGECNRKPCDFPQNLDYKEIAMIVRTHSAMSSEDTWHWSDGQPADPSSIVSLACPASMESRASLFQKPGRFVSTKAMWTKTVLPNSFAKLDDVPEPIENQLDYTVVNDQLIINSLRENVTGTYRFGFQYQEDKFETVCFFNVYMYDKEIVAKKGENVTLECRALGMWPIVNHKFSGSWKMVWRLGQHPKDQMVNMKVFLERKLSQPSLTKRDVILFQRQTRVHIKKDLSPSGLTLWDTEYFEIDEVNEHTVGTYSCSLEHYDIDGRKSIYETNRVTIVQAKPELFWNYFAKWFAKRKWIFYTVFTVIVIMISYSILVLSKKSQEIARKTVIERNLEIRLNLQNIER